MKKETKCPFVIGKSYFVRSLTYHILGKVKNVSGNFLVLEQASWIADSGRFTQAIDNGTLDEVEPVKCNVIVAFQNIVDAFEWKHKLPREQK